GDRGCRVEGAPVLQVGSEAYELRHRPRERRGRACALAELQIGARAFRLVPDLFRHHQAIVCEAQHRVEAARGLRLLTARDCVLAALAREQSPQPTLTCVMPVPVPGATVV